MGLVVVCEPGNARDACLRFLRIFGVSGKRSYEERTKPEEQRLLDLIAEMSIGGSSPLCHKGQFSSVEPARAPS
jgi:hypothetical protein